MMFYSSKNTILLLGSSLFCVILINAQVDVKKCLKRNGLFPKPGSFCKKYYRCKHWIPVEETCPPDQNFNAIKGWCDWMDLYPCLEKPKSKECPRANGRFLKPGTNCKKYYDCCNGKPKEKKCPKDQLFDPANEKCEWPELYTCVESLSTVEASPKTHSTTFRILASTTSDNSRFRSPGKISQPVSIVTTASWISDTSISSRFISTYQHDLDSSSNTVPKFSSTRVPSNTGITTITSMPEKKISASTIDEKISTSIDNKETSTSTSNEKISKSIINEKTRASSIDEKISTSIIDEEISTSKIRSSESPIFTTSPGSSSVLTKSDYVTDKNKIPESTADKFTSTKSTLMIKEEMRTSTRILDITETLNILCPEPNGYFPHPTNKHKFIGCVNNIPSILTCPHDLIYRHELGRCEYE